MSHKKLNKSQDGNDNHPYGVLANTTTKLPCIDPYERMFGKHQHRTSTRQHLKKGEHPELDTSNFLDEDGKQQYQSLIGSIHWAISLRQFDISVAVMTLSGFHAVPRQGHLERVKRVYYKRVYYKGALRLDEQNNNTRWQDSTKDELDQIDEYNTFNDKGHKDKTKAPDGYKKMRHSTIRVRTDEPDYSGLPPQENDWMYTEYGTVKEQLTHDLLTALGNYVTLTHYCDVPITWQSKKQALVATSTQNLRDEHEEQTTQENGEPLPLANGECMHNITYRDPSLLSYTEWSVFLTDVTPPGAPALHVTPEPHTVTTKEPNYETMRPLFGWLPTSIIKETFARTTQMARMPMSNTLKNFFRSPYPALNVHRRNEPVATDTIYSDTPAIDDGATMDIVDANTPKESE
jgi:hypothetical protein